MLDPEQNNAFYDNFLEIGIRPVQGDVHRYRQQFGGHSPSIARSYGNHKREWVYDRRKGSDREAALVAQTIERARTRQESNPTRQILYWNAS